jgi:hypothetical protein
MDSQKQCCYQSAAVLTYDNDTSCREYSFMPDGSELPKNSDILALLQARDNREVFVVNSRKRNGLILFKSYHAEFAGPGAMVGGDYDRDCHGVLPIGNLSLIKPQSYEERRDAYLIRRQWIRLINQITLNQEPHQRVQRVLDQFEQCFPEINIDHIPDVAFALLVGVLPQTVVTVRGLGGGENRFNY